MIKSLAAFQNQAFFNCNYELFVAKDDNIAIYRYSYADCKWSKEREGEFKFSPDAVAAFQNSKNLNYEWFSKGLTARIESNPKELSRFFLVPSSECLGGGRLFRTTHRVIATTKYLLSKMDTPLVEGLVYWEWHEGVPCDASGGSGFQNHAP
jgi:hypothetical protein